MKALLAVIASLSISPAYAFENLIVDSAFQHPVVLTGNVQSSGWTNVTSSPSVPFISGSIGGIATAATTVVVAVPNPFVGASAASVGSATNLPGNSGGSQLVATTANIPPTSPNISQPLLAVPTAVAANSRNIAPAVAVAVPNPFVGASAVGSTVNLPGNSGSQLVTTAFNVTPITPEVSQPSVAAPSVVASKSPKIVPAAPIVAVAVPDPVPPMSPNISQPSSAAPTGPAVASNSSNNLNSPGPSGTAGARKTTEIGNVFLVGKIQGGSAGTTNGAGGGGGAGNANSGGDEKGGGGGGGAGRARGSTFNIADVFSGDNSGKRGVGAGSTNGGATHDVPGPEAGTGLPILILLACIAYGVMKRRMRA